MNKEDIYGGIRRTNNDVETLKEDETEDQQIKKQQKQIKNK